MKKIFVLLFALALPLLAGPLVQIDPAGGAITGTPGGITGWGFTVDSDPVEWISFAGSFLLNETNPGLGVYTDLIGASGGPLDFLLPAGAATWAQGFSDAAQTGIGSYALSPGSLAGDQNSGLLRVLWVAYSADPYTCGSCFTGSFQQDFDFQVVVMEAPAQSAPEPATLSVVLIAAALFAYRRAACDQ
ncbi:MAG: hypothetical protein ABI806_07850 [Candidatus Solibacter sp.]